MPNEKRLVIVDKIHNHPIITERRKKGSLKAMREAASNNFTDSL